MESRFLIHILLHSGLPGVSSSPAGLTGVTVGCHGPHRAATIPLSHFLRRTPSTSLAFGVWKDGVLLKLCCILRSPPVFRIRLLCLSFQDAQNVDEWPASSKPAGPTGLSFCTVTFLPVSAEQSFYFSFNPIYLLSEISFCYMNFHFGASLLFGNKV